MRRRSFASLVLLLAYLPACTSWQATGTPLAELTAPPKASPDLRVTTATHGPMELTGARGIGDSLVGVIAAPGTGRRVVLLPAITKVEVRKADAGKTGLLIGVPLAVGAAVYLVWLGNEFNQLDSSN